MPKSALDKDLKKVGRLEEATQALSRSIAAPGLAILFLIAIFLFMIGLAPVGPLSLFVIAGGVIAGYMALNIGANDVANNMGPAVGSRALPLGAALVIAAICEAAGAILAGGDVVNTISKDIVRPAGEIDVRDFVMLMMASFLAAAIWIHLATFLNAPVSTTHSIVGGVLGAGIAAAGFGIVNWPTMGAIAASWVISPVLGGLIAAALLGFVKWQVLFREDRAAPTRSSPKITCPLTKPCSAPASLPPGNGEITHLAATPTVSVPSTVPTLCSALPAQVTFSHLMQPNTSLPSI